MSRETNTFRVHKVRFIDEKLSREFERLKTGKSEEKRLAENLERTISELKRDPFCGVKIPRRLWPKEYVRNYGVDNLWKFNLPDGWRLIYTLVGSEVEIIAIVLEWFNHPDYANRFGYKKR